MTKTIIAEKMVFGGDCIGKIEGKTVFIPYAVPGETLEVEIIQEERDYMKARIVKVLQPSPYRREPFCQYYGKCGGCNMQHIESGYQQTLRKEILKSAFEREQINVPEIEVIAAGHKAYRSRFQFHNGGMMEKRSNSIVEIENCPCAEDEINLYLKEVPFDQRPKGRVHVFGSSKIVSIPEGFDKIIIADEKKKPEDKGSSFSNSSGKKKNSRQKIIQKRFSGTVIDEHNLCTIELLGKKLTFDVQGFFQSNLNVLEKAIPFVTEGLKGCHVLDMYAGAGTFSVFLSDLFENVTLVEHNRDALVFAEQNLFGKKHQSYGVSGETWIKYHSENCIKQYGNFDAVVIDPPRSGMEKAVCQWLQKSNIPQIRSVSCDIATHARDAKFLIKAGYRLTKLFLLDFYPQTGHIESLAWFEK